jgi:methylglutaconyl-CoA hydratase
MAYANIEVTRSGPCTTISINRPAFRNALTAHTIQELHHAFSAVSEDRDARSVLFTGSGSEAFCAGADLQELRNASDPAARRSFFEAMAELITTISKCPVPVVAAVQGFALAGGMGLVAASDIALASDDAVFGLPEVAIGLAPMVVAYPLSVVMNPRTLSYMALSGERITAIQAYEAGLISKVVQKASLMDEARALCAVLAKRGPNAVSATKQALRDLLSARSELTMLELADRSALVSIGAEAQEGIDAFSEKRPPKWS